MRGDTNTGVNLIIPTTNDGDRLRARIGNGPAARTVWSGALVWDTDTWYHIALIYSADTGNLSVYRNGDQVIDSTDATFGELAANSHGWRVANRGISTHGSLPGVYDNFRVSNIPEPSVIGLLLLGAGAVAIRRRRSP